MSFRDPAPSGLKWSGAPRPRRVQLPPQSNLCGRAATEHLASWFKRLCQSRAIDLLRQSRPSPTTARSTLRSGCAGCFAKKVNGWKVKDFPTIETDHRSACP